MTVEARKRLLSDLLGSVHIFSSAVEDLMAERLEAALGHQITLAQVKLLKLISLTDAYRISEVASFLGVSNAAASKAADRLVRRNLLRRGEAEGDRRAVGLSLTDEGRRVLGRYEEVTDLALQEALGRFSDEELEHVTCLLDRLSLGLVECSQPDEAPCFRCSVYFREKCLLRAQMGRECHFDLGGR